MVQTNNFSNVSDLSLFVMNLKFDSGKEYIVSEVKISINLLPSEIFQSFSFNCKFATSDMVVQLRIKIYTKYVMIILRKTCLFLSSTSNFFKLLMYIMKHRKYMCCNAMIAFTSCNQYFYQVFAFELLVYNSA